MKLLKRDTKCYQRGLDYRVRLQALFFIRAFHIHHANFKSCWTSILAFRKYIYTSLDSRNLKRIKWIHAHELSINNILFPSFLELNLNWQCGEDLQKLCHSVHIERCSHWRVDLHLKLFISPNKMHAGKEISN